jgi:hypothetical protein
MASEMTHRLQRLYLATLQLGVVALLISLLFADSPAVRDYMPFVQYGLFLLPLVLLISALHMFSEHRLLALTGLGLIAFMILLFFAGLVLGSRR